MKRIPALVWQCLLVVLFLVPVVMAQRYNLEGSPGVYVSAIISLGLWLLFVSMVTGSIQHQAARLLLRVTLLGLLGIYFFGQFVSYYLQGSDSDFKQRVVNAPLARALNGGGASGVQAELLGRTYFIRTGLANTG